MHRRFKPVLLSGSVVLGALSLLACTMTWYTIRIAGGESAQSVVLVAGDSAAPGLAALGLTTLALVAALAIARVVVRLVLGTLQVVIGCAIAWNAIASLLDPVAAAASEITSATGVAGSSSIRELVVNNAASTWPTLTIIFGVLIGLTGTLVIASASRWPVSPAKYQQSAGEDDGMAQSGVADWDALSDGSDPTSR